MKKIQEKFKKKKKIVRRACVCVLFDLNFL